MKKLIITTICFLIISLVFSLDVPPNIIKNNDVIYIRTYGKVDKKYVSIVKSSLEEFYRMECIVKESIEVSDTFLTKSKLRIDAPKLLNHHKSNTITVIVTEKDISCFKNNNPEWGVLGLGHCPGSVCVVSTFRMKKNVSEKVIVDRLKKVSIHEVGHNFGLEHCESGDNTCVMRDKRGKIKRLDSEKNSFCNSCKTKYFIFRSSKI